MTKSPYPGYHPNNTSVTHLGNMARNCLVIELLSLSDELDQTELALVQEAVELSIDKLKSRIPSLESIKVVTPDRFDPLLRNGLRL